jgi:glycerate kinase
VAPRVVIAPQGFKECLDAVDVAEAIADGVRLARPAAETVLCPVADGGEGTVAALLSTGAWEARRSRVTGPCGTPIVATWARQRDGTAAAIEMAAAAGLALVPREARDPGRMTTAGVGELVRCAVDDGARRLLIGAGGSASCDGGAGLLQVLGAVFHEAGGAITVPVTGAHLAGLVRIEIGALGRPPLAGLQVEVLCDVDNPLHGPSGAASVYAPQKGSTPEQVEALDRGLRRLAACFPAVDPEVPGSGAGGGVGFGLAAAVGARLERGAERLLEALGVADLVRGADLVLTGEGRLDAQTARGKAPYAVAVVARRAGVPAVALVGQAAGGAEALVPEPLAGWVALGAGDVVPTTLDPGRTREALRRAAATAVRRWLGGWRPHGPAGA